MVIPFIQESRIYKPDEVIEFIDYAVNDESIISTNRRNQETKQIEYCYNIPA